MILGGGSPFFKWAPIFFGGPRFFVPPALSVPHPPCQPYRQRFRRRGPHCPHFEKIACVFYPFAHLENTGNDSLCTPSTIAKLTYHAYVDPRQPGRLPDRYAAFQRFAQRCVPFVPLKSVKPAASVIPAVFVFTLSLQVNPRFCNL